MWKSPKKSWTRACAAPAAHPCVKTVTDRAAKAGDELVLDYAGYADGVQFPGGTAENQTLTLGSGTFIPGFEDQLVGAARPTKCACM